MYYNKTMRRLAISLVLISAILMLSFVAPTTVATSHGADICSKDAESYNTETVYVNDESGVPSGAYIEINGGSDTCSIEVEAPDHHTGELTELEKAIIAVDYDGKVIVNEHSNFGSVEDDTIGVAHSGAVIGSQESKNTILEDGKSFTIKGEDNGIPVIKSKSGQIAPLVFANNQNEKVTVENVVLSKGQRAVHVQSKSNVLLREISVDGSVDSVDNGDAHILFEDSIVEQDSTGSIVRTSRNYYPDQSSDNINNVRDVAGVNLPIIEPNPSVDPTNPSAFIFERQEQNIGYDPVVSGSYSYSGEILVDADHSRADDDVISSPFESLDAALSAASGRSGSDNSRGNVIKVRSTSGGDATVDGIGVGSEHSLSIVGDSNTPQVDSIDFSYPGSYNIENIEIQDEVQANTPGVNLDASEVFWGGLSSVEEIKGNKVTSHPSSTVAVSPWCEDSDCDSLTRDGTASGVCVYVQGSIASKGCDGTGSDVSIDIQIDGSESGSSDIRSGDVTVEKSGIKRAVDVDLDVTQSAQDTDASIRLARGQPINSAEIQPDFSPVRDRTTLASGIAFNPKIVGQVSLESNTGAESVRIATSLDSTMIDLVEEETEDTGTDVVNVEDGDSSQSSSVRNSSVEGLIENQKTFVSVFNSGVSDQSSFEDNTIPPVSINQGGFTGAARGEVMQFGNARLENGLPATITPTNAWDVGFGIESLPPAQNHVLNMRYAYQATNVPANSVDLEIVDSSGQEIYTGRDGFTIEPTVGVGENPYEPGDSSSATEIREMSIPLDSLEEEYIRDNGNIYVTLENNDYQNDKGQVIFLLYEMSINSTDNVNENNSPSAGEDDEDNTVDSQPLPGDIDVEVNVKNADFNEKYDTYDVRPKDTVNFELVFENLGDTAVSGEFDIDDTHYLKSGQFVDENQFNPDQNPETTKIRESIQINLGTGEESVKVRNYQLEWPDSDFGKHEIRVKRADDESIDGDGEVGFDTYVLQETTPVIESVKTPGQHLTYDSINAEVTIENIGDISGDVTLNSQFGNWEATETIELPEGDTRLDESSQNVTVAFRRSSHPESDTVLFNRREYTTPSEVINDEDGFEISETFFDSTTTHGNGETVYYRPNAPFAVEKGERTFTAEIESQIDIGERTGQIDTSSALTDVATNKTVIDQLRISNFEVTTSPQTTSDLSNKPTEEEATVYASAWPYVHPSMSEMIMLRPYASHRSPTLSGDGFMFSNDLPPSADGQTVNRGSLPINHPSIDLTSQPNGKYLSTYFSTRNRACNANVIKNDGASMVLQEEASEADAPNTFIPFSAQSCDDKNRIREVQPMQFAGTTGDDERETDSRFSEDSVEIKTIKQHPENLEIEGVNPETFEQLDESRTVMMASVRLSNPVDTEYRTTARIEIVTNRSISGGVVGMGGPSGQTVAVGSERFDDNVVGAAAVRMTPNEEITVQIPIVIRNNEDVSGVHELSVRPRADAEDTEDYIEFDASTSDSSSALSESPITGEEYDRFTIPIKVETYGDAALTELEPADRMSTSDVSPSDDPISAQAADAYAYSVCRSNGDDSIDSRADAQSNFKSDQGTYSDSTVEGLNPRSGTDTGNPIEVADGVETAVGQCESGVSESDEKVTMEATYRNYGGKTIDIRPEMIAEFETRPWHANLHRKNAHATGDRFFANYRDDPGSNLNAKTWSTRPGEITLDPGEEKTVTFERRFQEPGLYHLRVSPCRDISSNGPQQYNLEGFTGIPETVGANSPSTDPGHWTTVRDGIDRTEYTLESPNERRYNEHSTPEMENSVFHGSQGCAQEVSSVFVYDSTKPVADFRRAHDETTIAANTEDYNHAIPQSGDFGFSDEIETPEVNIIFAVDDSGSVSGEQEDIRDSIIQFVREQPRWYNYGFESYHDGSYWRSDDLKSYDSNEEFVSFMQGVTIGNQPGSGSPMSLGESLNQFDQYASSDAENYIIALGDGDELDGSGCDNARNSLKNRDDVTIITVYFGNNCGGGDPLRDLAYEGPDGDKLFYNSNTDDYISAFNSVAREVIGGGVFQVTEGGMLFLDGSTVNRADCGNCYSRPHFTPYRLETPRLSPDFPGGEGSDIAEPGEDFRQGLRKAEGVVHSHRMSVDNARIAGVGMPNTLSGGGLQETHPLIDEPGMRWEIESGDPNYGQDRFCTDRDIDGWDISDPDHHCYMEQFEGGFNQGTGNTPDYYEVVPHRFTTPGEKEVELTVWDDPTLTRGEPHSNTTSIDVTVDPDNTDPEASIEKDSTNDLSYDKESSADTIWHRMEGVYSQNLDYRDSVPDNFNSDSRYDDTYEGVRTCLTTESSDGQIGISQDRWSQTEGGLDAGTRVIDEDSYVREAAGPYNSVSNYPGDRAQHILDVNASHTRGGYFRCLVFSQSYSEGSDGGRSQTFQYEAWDYAENKDSDTTEEIDIEQDNDDPTIDTADVNYESSVDDDATANDFIWAYNSDTSGDQDYYRGGDLSFDIIGSDDSDGIGTACLDLRLSRGSGLEDENSNKDIHENCATMGDVDGEEPDYEGIYGNTNSLTEGTGFYGMGTNSDNGGYHNDEGMFSAYELSTTPYEYEGSTNSGNTKTTTETENAYLFDWHGNSDSTTFDITIKHDGVRPDIDTTKLSCGDMTPSCSDQNIDVSSNGYTGDSSGEGGTPIVDAEIISDSWTKVTDNDGSTCGGTNSKTAPDPYVISLPEGSHDGTVKVNNDASVTADAGTCSGSCSDPSSGEDCEGPSTAEIEYDWEYTLKIWDAHGNTETNKYSGTVYDYEKEDEDCDSCPDNDDEE